MGVNRQDAKAAKMGRWAGGLGALGVLAVLLSCSPPPDVAHLPTVSLRLSGTPREATVIVDEEAVGTLDFVAAHGIALPVGVHHVTVKAQGYFPWDREVEAKQGQGPIVVQAALQPIPD